MATVGVATFVEDTVGFDVSLDDEGDVVGFGLDVVALGAAVDDAVGAELEGRADDEAVVGATSIRTSQRSKTCLPLNRQRTGWNSVVPCPTLVEVQPATKAPARTSAAPARTHRKRPAIPGCLPFVIGRL